MRITRFFILFFGLLGLTLVACRRYPNEFKNAHGNTSHAIVRGTKYPNGGHAFATHINGQPTSFWRSSDAFRISPGSNNCQTAYSDRKETIGYKTAHFSAVAGREYVISRKREPGFASPFTATPHPTTTNAWIIHDWRDRAMIHELKSSGPAEIVAEAPREDYVFGLSSSNLAIAQYHKRNP
jgi:hypothetical protein